MEESKQMKLKPTNVIALIITVMILTIGIVSVLFIDGNNSGEILDEVKEKPVQKEERKEEKKDSQPNDNYEKDEISFEFLKMENESKNMIYSPLSIKYALKMLNEGANGNTKTQIENVIGNNTLTKYDNIEDILSLANALYIRDTFAKKVKDEYNNKLINDYNAEIKYDEFKSANNINNWIEEKTFGQINNMINDGDVTNPENVMFLINALAIDMEWKDAFDAEDTHGNTFYLEDGNTMEATMMYEETKSDNISYYKDDDIVAVAMELKQYENEQMEFIAIMPEDNLSDYVEKFEIEDYEKIVNNLKKASKTKAGLNIHIPRFSFDYDLNLKNDLVKLGITDAFTYDIADFSNMSTDNTLYVSKAEHKANIDFSERGVKAAAVTVILMTCGIAPADPVRPIEININKPFMFVIRDKETNEIWFVGTVYEPNLWEDDVEDYQYR